MKGRPQKVEGDEFREWSSNKLAESPETKSKQVKDFIKYQAAKALKGGRGVTEERYNHLMEFGFAKKKSYAR